MRIGILTYHYAPNYGAVLQTYASVRLLQALGHEVYVVDYRNAAVARRSGPFFLDHERLRKEGQKYLLKYPAAAFIKLQRSLALKRFISNRLPLCTYAEASGLDLLLAGSDQIWNKQITGGRDAVYYGESFPGVPKAAWAASAGKTLPDKEDIDLILKNFRAISVREQSIADLLPGSTILPDPTLMLGAEEWKALAHPIKGRYLLAYPMLYEEEVMTEARRKAKELGLELKVLLPQVKLGAAGIQTASPEEFLSLINSAEYVVTSSFHGAAFSLLFERPHTFVHHDDPRFDNLLCGDAQELQQTIRQFLYLCSEV